LLNNEACRVTASILISLGLEACIGRNHDEYVRVYECNRRRRSCVYTVVAVMMTV
jgi:hypothetical protein